MSLAEELLADLEDEDDDDELLEADGGSGLPVSAAAGDDNATGTGLKKKIKEEAMEVDDGMNEGNFL